VSFDDGMVSEHYDVIIVGSGAGCGALAHMLGREGRMLLGRMS
jgi:choline dehydrogenase-like flavoprotein